MNWSNVKLILAREIRDQLRDRRTLFMIAVLPLFLYPLLGMSFFQVAQFMREHPIRVLVLDAPQDTALPPLVEGDRFAADLFHDPDRIDLVQVTSRPDNPAAGQPDDPRVRAREEMQAGGFDVVVAFPPDFSERYTRFSAALEAAHSDREPVAESQFELPDVIVYPNLSRDASLAAYRRVADLLSNWRDEIARRSLAASHVPAAAAKPFQIGTRDVAQAGQHTAAAWSKILPFVLLLWALTGAFYPAVDLCAGEKERGTLETLLSSPAERLEIVWGKLLTIMLFSIATAVLNLASLAVTGALVLSQLPNMGPPPALAFVWLLIALIPMSALFAALCLALAALARSTREGQYYLMPLVLVTMPLVVLPMAPGVELNLGNSLIPITGVVLLLRAMLEGNFLAVVPYAPVVVAVTLSCCLLAIRWATNQFNRESVLFRESERWDVGLWLRHLVRDRGATPSFAEAMFCGMLILLIKFFMSFAMVTPNSFAAFVMMAAVTQLVVIATPALLMTVMLTRSPRQTLLLRRPAWRASALAVLLAVALHPTINLLQVIVSRVYPINQQVAASLNRLILETDNLGLLLFVIAVLPALCEELAFRGFILSGLRHMGHKWSAIMITSVFFGAAHVLFQQSVIAFLVGLILGFIAVQAGSLLPCVLFHAVHNSMAVLVHRLIAALGDEAHWLDWLVRDTAGEEQLYHWPVIALGALVSAAILYWFHRMPYARTPEESLQEAIEHQTPTWLPG